MPWTERNSPSGGGNTKKMDRANSGFEKTRHREHEDEKSIQKNYVPEGITLVPFFASR